MTGRGEEFRRFYLALRISNQRQYYSDRAIEYRTAHRQVVIVRNVLLLLAAIAGAAGQLTDGTARAACSVGAAILASLAGAITGFDSLIGFQQLEKLFSDAERNLEVAEIDWDSASGGADAAAQIDRVELIFRSEIGQWGQLVLKAATPDQPVPDDPADDRPAS